MLVLEETPRTLAVAEAPVSGEGAGPDTGRAFSPLPDWAGRAPHWQATAPVAEAPLARPLAPARPDDAMLGPLPPRALTADGGGDSRPARRVRRRSTVATWYMRCCSSCLTIRLRGIWSWRSAGSCAPASGLDAQDAQTLAGQVAAVLQTPALAPLFSPAARAEQRLAGVAGRAGYHGAGRPHVRAAHAGSGVRL
jgi:ATP-dependent helicase/nuclease subunit A